MRIQISSTIVLLLGAFAAVPLFAPVVPSAEDVARFCRGESVASVESWIDPTEGASADEWQRLAENFVGYYREAGETESFFAVPAEGRGARAILTETLLRKPIGPAVKDDLISMILISEQERQVRSRAIDYLTSADSLAEGWLRRAHDFVQDSSRPVRDRNRVLQAAELVSVRRDFTVDPKAWASGDPELYSDWQSVQRTRYGAAAVHGENSGTKEFNCADVLALLY